MSSMARVTTTWAYARTPTTFQEILTSMSAVLLPAHPISTFHFPLLDRLITSRATPNSNMLLLSFMGALLLATKNQAGMDGHHNLMERDLTAPRLPRTISPRNRG